MKKDLVIALVPDSFKESMTAKEACEAMERGIRKVNNDIKCIHIPMAVKELCSHFDSRLKEVSIEVACDVNNPLCGERGASNVFGPQKGATKEMVIEYANLEDKIKDVDMVWTGEGSIDFQTQYGKTPLGVAAVAKKYNKPVIALAGRVGDGIEVLYEKGIDSIFGITKGATSLKEALERGQENTEKTAENIIRLMKLL